MTEKEEFEKAGFTDYDAKLAAWEYADTHSDFQITFACPPVSTAYWTTQSWLRWVNWTMPGNAFALEAARHRLEGKRQ